ncbi:MAG TPA: molybdate ABC transporter substrate-binding protein [Micromonosporaceae bacterium]|nr:molybdate ABC transporter substrate-binding protein [Micromonosporaceae bacterium]
MWRKRLVAVSAAAIVAALALAGCGSSGKSSSATSTPGAGTTGANLSGTITVLAAASLTGTFNQLGQMFQAAHPGTTIKFSYGGSDTLAAQIVQGAPVDVFAAASPTTMKTVTDAGDNAGTPQNFVKNQLVIAVPPGNPKHLASLKDLTDPKLKVVLCAPTVPCGTAATKAEQAAGLTIKPVSEAPDVKSALTPVELGEADAALVYRTDAKAAAGKVDAVEFPESALAINTYPIVALKGSKNTALANAWVSYIVSPEALAVFTAAGFQAP